MPNARQRTLKRPVVSTRSSGGDAAPPLFGGLRFSDTLAMADWSLKDQSKACDNSARHDDLLEPETNSRSPPVPSSFSRLNP
jgi:hypothetical protein